MKPHMPIKEQGCPQSWAARTLREILGYLPSAVFFSIHDQTGSPALSLRVSDVDALLKRVKAAGMKVISSGGEPVNLGMSRNVFVEDPNGVAVELIQRAN